MLDSGHPFYNKKTLRFVFIVIGVIALFDLITAFLIFIKDQMTILIQELNSSLESYRNQSSDNIVTAIKTLNQSTELKNIINQYQNKQQSNLTALQQQYLTQLAKDCNSIIKKQYNINWQYVISNSLKLVCLFFLFNIIIPFTIPFITFLRNYNKVFKKKVFNSIFITSIIMLIAVLIWMGFFIKQLISTMNEKEQSQLQVTQKKPEFQLYLNTITAKINEINNK